MKINSSDPFDLRLGCAQDGNGAYCSVVSPIITISANAATSVGTLSFMPQLTTGGTIVGGVNYFTTLCLCEFNAVTTATGAVALIPFGSQASSAIKATVSTGLLDNTATFLNSKGGR